MRSFLIVMLNDREGAGTFTAASRLRLSPWAMPRLGQRVVVIILLSRGDTHSALKGAWASQALAHPAAVVPSL